MGTMQSRRDYGDTKWKKIEVNFHKHVDGEKIFEIKIDNRFHKKDNEMNCLSIDKSCCNNLYLKSSGNVTLFFQISELPYEELRKKPEEKQALYNFYTGSDISCLYRNDLKYANVRVWFRIIARKNRQTTSEEKPTVSAKFSIKVKAVNDFSTYAYLMKRIQKDRLELKQEKMLDRR